MDSQQAAEVRIVPTPPHPQQGFPAGFLATHPVSTVYCSLCSQGLRSQKKHAALGPSSSFQKGCFLRRRWGYFGKPNRV